MQLLLSTFTAAVERMRLAGSDCAVIRVVDGIAHLDVAGRDSLPYSSTKLGMCDEPQERICAAASLVELARSLSMGAGPDAMLQLDFDDAVIHLAAGRTRARLAATDADPDVAQVPYLDDGETFEWTANLTEAFKAALRYTENDGETILGQVVLTPGWVVATDKFSMFTRRLSEDLPPLTLPASVTLLTKQFGPGTTCTLAGGRLQFEDELGHALLSLYAGGHEFPSAWKTLVDFEDDGYLECDRKALLAAIDATTTRTQTRVTLIVEEQEIAVRGRTTDNDWIEQRIDGFGRTVTDEPIVGMGITYVGEQLRRCVSTVDFEGPLRIALRPLNRTPHQGFTAIRNAGTTVLVQPIRSNS